MNLALKGRTAIVCGSTQGIGWACAVELAELGAHIVEMNVGRGDAATALLLRHGGFVPADDDAHARAATGGGRDGIAEPTLRWSLCRPT